MPLTVKKLRELLKRVDGELPVYWADHDHHEFGTNSIAGSAFVVNQSDASEDEKQYLERNPEFKIKGPYFLIRP